MKCLIDNSSGKSRLKKLIGIKFQYKESLRGDKIWYEGSDTKAEFSI